MGRTLSDLRLRRSRHAGQRRKIGHWRGFDFQVLERHALQGTQIAYVQVLQQQLKEMQESFAKQQRELRESLDDFLGVFFGTDRVGAQ
jgi:hypothetical protein